MVSKSCFVVAENSCSAVTRNYLAEASFTVDYFLVVSLIFSKVGYS